MAKRQPSSLVVVVDTREKTPYLFESLGAQMVRRKLDSGDYSAAGYESRIAIERKTKADAYGCLGKQRARFKREIERLAGYEYAAIVIECSFSDFLRNPPATSQMSPRAAVNSLLSWSVRYGVHVWFADERDLGEAMTLRLLEKFVKDREAHDGGA